MSRGRHAVRVLAYAGMGLVLLYRYTLGTLFPASCKYHPSCSRYAFAALREHGFLRGSGLAAWRLARCNPWSRGGFDPVRPR
ncbi:MAG: membrane protein insertion efficiency factor YidD [Gaiellaceae bacterium]